MKKIYKKISAIGSSLLMTGLTVGIASAATFPAPFVVDGKTDLAIVYGATAQQLDQVQATNIQEYINSQVDNTIGNINFESEESFELDKDSNHFNFNNELNGIHSTLDDEDMSFLADGTYDDGDIDEDYEQKIILSDKKLTLFADSDYNDDEPAIGFFFEEGNNILNYSLEYDKEINFTDMQDTDLPLMGGEYYVLSSDEDSSTIELLDSAEKRILVEGETITIDGRTISIEYINADSVKFNVDGELTDKLKDYESYKLEDESYIIANEVLYTDKEGSASKVELSLGKGKIVLKDGEEVEINDEDVDGLTANFVTNSNGLKEISLQWDADEETFLTKEGTVTMPGFEMISLTFGGMEFPTEFETIALENGETMTLAMDNFNLDLAWINEDSTIDSHYGSEENVLVTKNDSNKLNLVEKNRFIVTKMDSDLGDIEQLYYEVTKIEDDSGEIIVKLKDLIDDNDLEFDALNDAQDRGDISISVESVDNGTDEYVILAFDGVTHFNKVVSDKGMVITLPEADRNDVFDSDTGFDVTFTEANKDNDIAVSDSVSFTATIKESSDADHDKLHVSSFTDTTTTEKEEVSNKQYVSYVESDLASKIMFDDDDENGFEVEYYGEEVTADVQVATGAVTISDGESGALGEIIVKDSEVESVKTKNLIIVGGSCINTAAAALLGGAHCGESFTIATGVTAGQFLIKGYEDSTVSDKLALLVAGYDATDTVNAVTYLRTQDVDTSKEYLITA